LPSRSPITPIPAVTVKHSIIQNCQNCGVLIAWSMWTLFRVTRPEAAGFGRGPGSGSGQKLLT
jgi:hypothetical protein